MDRLVSQLRVSIHAPLHREERRPIALHILTQLRFQSTPLSIERSDEPLPMIGEANEKVSIHAPLHREERRAATFRSARQRQFQSTPLSIERSDLRSSG